MALRIGGGKPKAPIMPQDEEMNLHASDEGDAAAEEMSEPAAEEQSETPEEESAEGSGGGVLDKGRAGYKTPDQGPFMCRNCIHYGVNGDGTCEVVSGPIDEEGVCNIFSSGHQQEMPLVQDEQPEEAPADEEADTPAAEEPEVGY